MSVEEALAKTALGKMVPVPSTRMPTVQMLIGWVSATRASATAAGVVPSAGSVSAGLAADREEPDDQAVMARHPARGGAAGVGAAAGPAASTAAPGRPPAAGASALGTTARWTAPPWGT